LAEIAYQKAGIIKAIVPVVTTAENPEALQVIEGAAAESRAPLVAVNRDFAWTREAGKPFQLSPVRVTTKRRDWGLLPLGLFGKHQGANAAATVAAVEQLRNAGIRIPDEAVAAGLRNVVWPARMELLSRRPVVVLDCAHNVASVHALVETVANSFPIERHRHLILAASSDKQIPEMLSVLASAFDHFHLTRYRSNPRSADPETVAAILRQHGKSAIDIYPGPGEAWSAARSLTSLADGIVIAGSVFLAGELRPRIVRECSS
jgi:dihydrofolate synthase/folylpolyglutamate synthase